MDCSFLARFLQLCCYSCARPIFTRFARVGGCSTSDRTNEPVPRVGSCSTALFDNETLPKAKRASVMRDTSKHRARFHLAKTLRIAHTVDSQHVPRLHSASWNAAHRRAVIYSTCVRSTRHRNASMYTASFVSLLASASAFVLPEGPWEHHWAVIVAG